MLGLDISSVLIVGLERLSYRGYDSAGIAVLSEDEISVWKKPGKVHVLAKQLDSSIFNPMLGLGILVGRHMEFQMK